MQTIGSYLKSGREARNIRLSEVARSTKISKWYLDCLEKDEFDKIPGGPYIKGYIASYASFIGIEEDEILKRYDSLKVNSDDNETSDHRQQVKKRRKLPNFSSNKKKFLLLCSAILILLALGANHFIYKKQLHVASLSAVAQDLHPRSAPAVIIKQDGSRLPFNDHSDLSPGVEKFTKNSGNEDQHDVVKNDVRSPKMTAKKPETASAISSPEEVDLKRPDLSQAKYAMPQDITGTAGLHFDSASDYQTSNAESQPLDNLRVVRAVTAGAIIDKDPAELIDSIRWSMERIYIWTMIECAQPPSSIRHTYYFEGQKVNDVVLEIKSPQWRTWSYKNLLDKRWIGQWRVDITSAERKLLQRVFFEVN